MAPHSSTLAWKIPWTEEPGGLQCTGHRESEIECPWVSPSEECSDELRYEEKEPIYLCNPLLETLSQDLLKRKKYQEPTDGEKISWEFPGDPVVMLPHFHY